MEPVTTDIGYATMPGTKISMQRAGDIPARLPLSELAPGLRVLDSQVKLITHAIRTAAYNTVMALAGGIRLMGLTGSSWFVVI